MRFFNSVSQIVTTEPFLCTVNRKENDYGYSLQNQVQALRSAVRAPHATGLWRTADVRGMRRICRNRNGDPLPACHKKLNTTQEEFNEQIEVTYMWD